MHVIVLIFLNFHSHETARIILISNCFESFYLMMWKAIVFLSFLLHVHSASIFLQQTTTTLGNGTAITKGPPTFSSTTIISQITPTFDAIGLTSIKICTKVLNLRGDGAVYSNAPESCVVYGTASGISSTDKFTADEWPTNIQPCISSIGLITALNVTTNLMNYWTAGNFTNCARTMFSYSAPNGAPVAIYGIGTGNRSPPLAAGIGRLQISYFYCSLSATNCLSALYNRGGKCGKSNGGCDLSVNCTNTVVNSTICSSCSSGFLADSVGVCRPIRQAPQYNLTGNVFPFDATPNGAPYQTLPFHYPPWKISRLNAQFEYVRVSAALTWIALTYKKVVKGQYDDSSAVVIMASGSGANKNLLMDNCSIDFGINEWITGFSSKIVDSNGFWAIGAITLTTNLQPLYMNSGLTDRVINTQSQNLSGQVLVTFNGTNGEYLDNVNFFGASCTKDCPTEAYGSGICLTMPSNTCVGGYCQDTSVSYTCTCYSGYIRVNASLCLPPSSICANCASGVICTMNAGPYGYECQPCPSGFTGSGYTQCQDVNECLTAGICGLSVCNNIPGNYTCVRCQPGYQADANQNCVDVDECLITPAVCGDNRGCNNTQGNYTCGACSPGYNLTNGTCVDIDECANSTCGSNRYCSNSKGNFTCGGCYAGYQLQNGTCQDTDECKSNATICPNSTCNNTIGNYTCGDCYRGYQLQNGTCQDVDECAQNTTICPNRRCYNTIGDFTCGGCFTGYQLQNGTCEDIDECTMNTTICPNRACNNTIGNYTCGDCYRGYQLQNMTCQDVDECLFNTTICGTTTCNNTIGNYTCGGCIQGYDMVNSTCQARQADYDFCESATCHKNAICTNTNSSYVCYCSAGFSGNGTYCDDINECDTNRGGCSFFATCQNRPGDWRCNCNLHYQGNGSYCSPLCGDSICNSTYEDCITCPQDCISASCGLCGDGHCNAPAETCSSCPNDCGVCSPTTCLGNPPCNNRGTCYDGICDCRDAWIGPSCSDVTQAVDVDVSDQTVSMTLNKMNFQIVISRVLEYDGNLNVVKEMNLASSNMTFVQNSTGAGMNRRSDGANKQWILAGQLTNGATLNISIWQLEETPVSHIKFADIDLTFPPHTMKFTFHINSWPFDNIKNLLGIEMNTAGPPSSSPSSCSNKDLKPDAQSVRWISLSYQGTSLYGRYYNRAVLDGRVRNITYVSTNNVNITALVPHFWDYAVVDPDFSMLLDLKDPCKPHHTKNSLSKIMILSIAIPVFILVLMIGLLACFWPKVSTWMKVKMHKEEGEMRELEKLKARSRAATIVRV